MPIQSRYFCFDHVRSAFSAAIVHAAADGVPAGDDIVTVYNFAPDTEGFAAIDNVLFAVLGTGRCGDAPAVIGDDHQHGQFVAWACAPDHAGGEIPFGSTGVAARDNGDAVAAKTLLHQCGPRRYDILHLNDGRDRQDVPIAAGEVAGEIATHGMRIGGR